MAELSEDEVIEVLGPVSDALAAEIIATGIDRAGLVAARDRVIRDRKIHYATQKRAEERGRSLCRNLAFCWLFLITARIHR
jgi:hypothetical protein